MNWASVPVALMAAVSFYVGFYYITLYLRRRAELHNFFFALTCFSISLYDFFCVALYNSATLADGMYWQRFQFASIALFGIALSWFIFYFTRYRNVKPFYFITVWLFLFFIAGFAVQNELTLSMDIPRIKHVKLGSLIDITYFEVHPGFIYQAQYIFMIFMGFFIIFIIVQYYLESDERRKSPLLITTVALFIASINDSLVGAGIYSFIYMLEYVYLFIIVFMAYVLQNNFIDLTNEVEELNVSLEEKINERTMELLFSEIGRGLYVEMLGEITGKKKTDDDEEISDDNSPSPIIKLAQDISVISNIEELLKKSLAKAMDISKASTGYLFMVNENGELELKASTVESDCGLSFHSMGIIEDVFQNGNPIITCIDCSEDGETLNIVCIPVRLREDVIGTSFFEKPTTEGHFTDEDADILTAFMLQSASAMEYAFLYQRMINKNQYAKQPSITSNTEEKMKKAILYIEENYCSDISREGLAASLNMHPDSLGRFFKMYTDKKLSLIHI